MSDRITKIITSCFIIAACFSSGGCNEDAAEIEKKIIAHDPSFQKILDKRDAMIEELSAKKAGYLNKRIQIDEEIETLKEEKSMLRTDYAEEIQRTKRRLNPEKRTLERELLEAERDYKRTKEEISIINSDIKEISELIGKKDKRSLTQEEMKTWNDRLGTLIGNKEAVTAEKNKLEADIATTKMKLKVLSVR